MACSAISLSRVFYETHHNHWRWTGRTDAWHCTARTWRESDVDRGRTLSPPSRVRRVHQRIGPGSFASAQAGWDALGPRTYGGAMRGFFFVTQIFLSPSPP